METFWRTIAYYNASTWAGQLILILMGICLTVLLVRRPAPWVKWAMKVYLAAIYLWVAVVYYFVCCRERDYNEVMALYWALLAAIWVWDLATGYTTFERSRKYDLVACVLLTMSFVYPLISLARGLTFPMVTSPVMPCSVSVFTIGLLLFFVRRVNLFLVLLSLGPDRADEGRIVSYPRGLCAGGHSHPGAVPLLQGALPDRPPSSHQARCEIHQRPTHRRLHWSGHATAGHDGECLLLVAVYRRKRERSGGVRGGKSLRHRILGVASPIDVGDVSSQW